MSIGAYYPASPLSQVPQPVQLKLFDVPAGNAGVGRTLSLMRSLALGGEGAQNAQIRQLASKILVQQNVASRDESAEARALSQWVQDTIRFTGEHNDAVQESLQSPVVTLQMRTGDCDDFAILLSALLNAVGIKNRFHVVKPQGQENNPDAPWSHVYVVATNKRTGEQLMLDPTLDNSSGYQFSNMQANSAGAEFGLGALQPGALGCHDVPNCGCKKEKRMPGLGDLSSTLMNVLDSPAITALAQGEAVRAAYGNNTSLTTFQQSTAANPFATPAQLGTGAYSTANALNPTIPTWMWIAGFALGGIALVTLTVKK